VDVAVGVGVGTGVSVGATDGGGVPVFWVQYVVGGKSAPHVLPYGYQNGTW